MKKRGGRAGSSNYIGKKEEGKKSSNWRGKILESGRKREGKKYLVIVVTTEVRDRKEKNRASLCEGKEIVCGTVYTKGVEVEFSRIFFSVNELLNSVSFCFLCSPLFLASSNGSLGRSY